MKLSRVLRAGAYVGPGPSGSPPAGMRGFEVLDGSPVGVLSRPAGSIAVRRDGVRAWLKTLGMSAPGWVELGALGFVTPEAYGAVGDGVTDDTTAVQAACDSVSAGGAVYCHGRYLISSQITVPSGVTIRGDAAPLNMAGYGVLVSPVAGPSVFLSAQPTLDCLKLGSRCGVEGIAFDSTTDAPTLTAGTVIDASNAIGVHIRNVFINRAFVGIKAVNSASWHYGALNIDNVQILHFKRSALELTNAVGTHMRNFLFIDNVYTATSVGIRGVGNVATLQCSHGTVYAAGAGVDFTGGIVDDVHFDAVDVDHSTGQGVLLTNAFNTEIAGCWIGFSGLNGVSILGTGQGVSIHDTYVLANGQSGIALNSTMQYGTRIHDCGIYGNNTTNSPYAHGIYMVDGSVDFSIHDNKIGNATIYPGAPTGYQQNGVRIGYAANASDYFFVKDNLISGNVLGGVLDNSTGIHKLVAGNL